MKMAPEHWLCIKEDDLVWAQHQVGKMGMESFLINYGFRRNRFVYNGKFNPSRYLELLQGFEINVLCCTPTEYRMMAKLDNLQEYNLEHLHSVRQRRAIKP